MASSDLVGRPCRRRRAARADSIAGAERKPPWKSVDAFACNQVRLSLFAGFGYQIMHRSRAVLERVTGTGWSLRRLAERVLRPRRASPSRAPDHDDHRRRVGELQLTGTCSCPRGLATDCTVALGRRFSRAR